MTQTNSELQFKIALTEHPLNPDQQINLGCNLKWKLGQEEEDVFLPHLRREPLRRSKA